MTEGYSPQQSYSMAEAKSMGGADLSEVGLDTGEDQFAHVEGKVCKSCGGPIEAGQPARLRGEADWVHDVCPIAAD